MLAFGSEWVIRDFFGLGSRNFVGKVISRECVLGLRGILCISKGGG